MHALADTPAAASATVTPPSAVAPCTCSSSAAPYAPATIANRVKSSTSRLIQARHLQGPDRCEGAGRELGQHGHEHERPVRRLWLDVPEGHRARAGRKRRG